MLETLIHRLHRQLYVRKLGELNLKTKMLDKNKIVSDSIPMIWFNFLRLSKISVSICAFVVSSTIPWF